MKEKIEWEQRRTIHQRFPSFSRAIKRRHTLGKFHNGCCKAAATGRSPGSNQKLFSAEIAERRNWTTVRGVRGGGRARRGAVIGRAERRGTLATASGFRVALCRATSFPTRDTYVSPFVSQVRHPIIFRSLAVFSRSFSCISRWVMGNYPAADSTRPLFLRYVNPESSARDRDL